MNNLLIGFILTGITLSSCQGQDVNCEIDALNKALKEIVRNDQEVRRKFMPALKQYQKDSTGKLNFIRLALKMQRADKDNQAFILKMFEKCGWLDAINTEAHKTIFLVLQHSPDSVMRKYFPNVQVKVKQGLLALDDEAIMYDRLQMNADLPQKYGSQTFAAANNINYIWPIQNLDSLSYFRSQVELPTMEEYIKLAKDSMNIEFVWDKSLTIEEAIKMKDNP